MTKMACCPTCKVIVTTATATDGIEVYNPHTGRDGVGVCAGTLQPVVVEAKRVPVDYIYHQLNWDFIHGMATIAHYADAKYGSVQQYANTRLIGEKSPVNHMAEHIRLYITGKPHDHFGNVESHLLAIAYNAMMEYFYYQTYGSEDYKLHVTSNTGTE